MFFIVWTGWGDSPRRTLLSLRERFAIHYATSNLYCKVDFEYKCVVRCVPYLMLLFFFWRIFFQTTCPKVKASVLHFNVFAICACTLGRIRSVIWDESACPLPIAGPKDARRYWMAFLGSEREICKQTPVSRHSLPQSGKLITRDTPTYHRTDWASARLSPSRELPW